MTSQDNYLKNHNSKFTMHKSPRSKNKLQLLLVFFCIYFPNISKGQSLPDSLKTIITKDKTLVKKLAADCKTCFINLVDTNNSILKKYYYEMSQEVIRTENEYYSDFPGRLFTVRIYNDSLLKEFRENIDVSDSSSFDVTYYFDNGKTSSAGSYKNGKKDGKWKEYYDTGVMLNSCSYTAGVKNGKYKEFFENDTKKVEGEYKDDLPEGRWLEYDSTGKITTDEEYKDGELFLNKSKLKKQEEEERLKKQLDEFHLDSATYYGCIYFMNVSTNDTFAIIMPHDIIWIKRVKNKQDIALPFQLKAIRQDTIYLVEYNASGKRIINYFEFPITSLKKIGYNSQTTGKIVARVLMTPPGLGLFAPKGYTMVSLTDKKYKIVLSDICR